MPKSNAAKVTPKRKPTAPVAPTQPPAPAVVPAPPPDLPVLYPKFEIDERSTTSPKGPLDIEWIVDVLGWETEAEFKKRMVAEYPGTQPSVWSFGDVFHCKDIAGEKVRCNNNAQNRPFDMGWCEDLIHTILHGQWAGPFTVPGETVNGETVRISKYGRVLSGQHQMTAAKLADEKLAKARLEGVDPPTNPKYPVWSKLGHVFIETIVIKGMSEDPRILMTVDYVKPRTAADVFYTSEVFKACSPVERKDLCRVLAAAVDFLWTRTATKGYRTHPEVVAFLERHKRLLEATEFIFKENGESRRIASLRLALGTCAALDYLMAASATSPDDSDVYRNMEPPSEKGIDLGMWDRAADFWALLAAGKDFDQVRTALGNLVDSTPTSETNQGLGGRGPEKLAILAKAWERWRDHPDGAGPPFDAEDLADGGLLSLSYNNLDDKGNVLPNGEIRLLDVADFYGIDSPIVVGSTGSKMAKTAPPDPRAPTKEEIWGSADRQGATEKLRAAAEARRQPTPKR